METKQPICWQQGTFLQPQHFQYNDAYFQYQLKKMNQVNSPYFWGVDTLEVSETALANHFIEIRNGRFLFKSGAYAEAPGNAVAVKRNFDSAWHNRDEPLPVYIGLKMPQQNMPNVTVVKSLNEADSVHTRFLSEEAQVEVADEYMDGPTAYVQTQHYVLRIFLGAEVEEVSDFELIQLGRIYYRGEDILWDAEYIPPCLRLDSSRALMHLVQEIRDDLTGRSHQLDIYKASPGRIGSDFDARSMIYISALQVLCRYIPVLTHFISTRTVSPWSVYTRICQLVGELSVYSDEHNLYGAIEGVNTGVEAYQHERLGDCMLRAKETLYRLCDNITFVPHQFIRFSHDGNYYTAEVQKDLFDRNFLYYIRAHIHGGEQNHILSDMDIASLIKVGATTSLAGLIDRALPGVMLTQLNDLPASVPAEAEGTYLRLDTSQDMEWRSVAAASSLSIFWPTPPEGLVLDLVAVRR